MKKLLLTAGLLVVAYALQAQTTSINFPSGNSNAPNGTVIPNVTATQRTNMTSLTPGLLVYQTDGAAGFYYSDGISWINLSDSPTGPAGGSLSGTYPNPTIADNAVTSLKIVDGGVNNIDIAVNAITTSRVANGTVTTSKMADSAVSSLKLLTRAVTNRHLADGAVTSEKVSAAGADSGNVLTYDGTSVNWVAPPAASGAAGGDLTGTYPNPTIANNAVTSLKIADGGVNNIDIAVNAITTSRVANGTVTTSKMADSAVSSLKLLTYAVNTRHIAGGAITTDKINSTGATTGDVLSYDGTNVTWAAPFISGAAGGDLTGTYPNPAIADGAITSDKILDGAVGSLDIADQAIINSKLAVNAVTTSRVANGTVTTSKMADSAISSIKLLTYAVTNRHIADGAVTAGKINSAGAITGDVLSYDGTDVVWVAPPSGGGSPTGAAGADLTGTYPNPTVANSAITSAKIADLSIQSDDIAANAVITSKIASNAVSTGKLDGLAVTEAKLASNAVTTTKLADGTVTTSKISSTGAANGNVLTYNGTGVVWAAPSSSGPAFLSGSGSLNFPTTNPGKSSDATTTIAVTGAQPGNIVALGVPATAMAAPFTYTAWVSSAGNVSVRMVYYGNGINVAPPANQTFTVLVVQP